MGVLIAEYYFTFLTIQVGGGTGGLVAPFRIYAAEVILQADITTGSTGKLLVGD